jgi:hypothetical protein
VDQDVLIFITLTTGAVLIISHLARIIRTSLLQKTIRQAIKSDSGVTAALLDKIDDRQPGGSSDDRTGLVLLALGAALFCYGLIQGDADDIRNMSGIALFPIFVGAVLLGRAFYMKRNKERGS